MGKTAMNEARVTVTLPAGVYSSLQRRAHSHQRALEDEATVTLTSALAADTTLPADVTAALDMLATLDDATLEQVSHSQPPVEDGILLAALTETRRRRTLTPGEERRVADIVERHDRVMALRAEAVALLHERGGNVGDRVAHA